MNRTAVYPGSFDPLTKGHLNIIERSAEIFDELTVAVVVNPGKNPLFSLEERIDLIRRSVSHINNVNVECFDGLLASYVNSRGYNAVIRGLRSAIDFEYEINMAQLNSKLYTGRTETVFLLTEPEYSFISSSMVKEIASLGGNIDELVPDCVSEKIKNKY